MSSVRDAKRALEKRLRHPVEFRRGPDRETDAPVEVHGPLYCPEDAVFGFSEGAPTTWWGSGETHLDAIADVEDTLEERARARRQAPHEPDEYHGGC